MRNAPDVKDVKSALARIAARVGCATLPLVGRLFTMRKPSFVLLVAVALVALLALLATLQYRWLGQVSAGERERMQSTLRASTARFTQDFDRELGRVYFGLQTDDSTVRAEAWADFAARYQHWQESAPYPRLVRAVYLVARAADNASAARLLRFDPATRTFTPVAWPAELTALQQRLAQKHVLPPVALPPAAVAALSSLTPSPLAGDIPALIIPATTTEPVALPARQAQPVMIKTLLAPTSYIVAVLDRDLIRTELLPALAQRYFASNGGTQLDYNLTVATRTEPPQLIYQTGPAAQTAGDARAGLFNVRFDEMDVFMQPGMPGHEVIERKQNLTFRVIRRTGTPPPAPGKLMRLTLNDETDGDWQLVVAHPAGSLDAAVASARQRSLAISFGVLLLLAASIALLVVATHRAQRLAQQQMQFVAGVSHELRTPLTVIYSAGENLADGVIADSAQVRRYGQVIRSEGRRLAEMVEQVLEFAGAQRGRRKLELHPVAVTDLIDSTLASWQTAQTNTPQIERHIASALPRVLADEPALKRALQNLLSNALKYGGEANWLSVSAQVHDAARGREVQIKVADRGIGIEPAELPHIFEPFYRGRDVRAAQIHGNGLGLSLVKDIVEAHGGRVTVESGRARGSTFTLHLPVSVNGNGDPAAV